MSWDFCIIGGGIAGVSAAARLSHLGSVLLLEAEAHLAHHTSGRSAALYEPNYGLPPVVALSQASGGDLRTIDGGVLGPRGMLLVAGADQDREFAGDCHALGLAPVSVEEARDMVPILNRDTVALAAYGSHAEDIDTDRLLQAFAREARKNGAAIETGARVTGILRGEGSWRIRAAGTDHAARILVNAAGAWADEVAQMAGVQPLGFTPLRRSMARMAAPGGANLSGWPLIMGVGESWYAKPDAGALIISPAEEDPSFPHDAWADDMVLAEGLARYQEMVQPPVTRPIATWAGLRTFAPDRVLVIGPDPRQPSFFWLAGQGGYGFQTSPAASRLAADLLAGTPPAIDRATVAALSPARFG
ncbi:MAG: FAD-binding oxidoreductase [Rhodobacteraceae bacterium]|nr:FAD-binding oxidoreductase [Paracoccaceae bacterium]